MEGALRLPHISNPINRETAMNAKLQKYYAADREVRIHANSEADQEFYFAPDVDERISRLSALNAELVKLVKYAVKHHQTDGICLEVVTRLSALLDEGEKQKGLD